MWIEDFAMWWSYLCYLVQPAMSCLLSSAPHWSGRVLQQCCQETSPGYTDTGRKACCLFAVAELALHNSINLYHDSGGMAFSLLVFCIVLSLMHSLAACLKLSPHCGTGLTRISCRWHMYTVPYIRTSTYILCIIHLMCGIGLFFIATSSSSLTVQIACHLIFCC